MILSGATPPSRGREPQGRPPGCSGAGARSRSPPSSSLVAAGDVSIRALDTRPLLDALGIEQLARRRDRPRGELAAARALAYIGGRIFLDHPLVGVGWQASWRPSTTSRTSTTRAAVPRPARARAPLARAPVGRPERLRPGGRRPRRVRAPRLAGASSSCRSASPGARAPSAGRPYPVAAREHGHLDRTRSRGGDPARRPDVAVDRARRGLGTSWRELV